MIKNLVSILEIMDNQEKKTLYHMIISKISVEDKRLCENKNYTRKNSMIYTEESS